METSIIIFMCLLILIIVLIVLLNIKVRKDIKSGRITEEDIKEADEEHRIW